MSSGLASTSTALCTSPEQGVLGSSSSGHTGMGCVGLLTWACAELSLSIRFLHSFLFVVLVHSPSDLVVYLHSSSKE